MQLHFSDGDGRDAYDFNMTRAGERARARARSAPPVDFVSRRGERKSQIDFQVQNRAFIQYLYDNPYNIHNR